MIFFQVNKCNYKQKMCISWMYMNTFLQATYNLTLLRPNRKNINIEFISDAKS